MSQLLRFRAETNSNNRLKVHISKQHRLFMCSSARLYLQLARCAVGLTPVPQLDRPLFAICRHHIVTVFNGCRPELLQPRLTRRAERRIIAEQAAPAPSGLQALIVEWVQLTLRNRNTIVIHRHITVSMAAFAVQ